jgi:hypothetical protein
MVFLIRDFNIEQVLEILRGLKKGNIGEDTIRSSRHVLDNWFSRGTDQNLVYSSLIDKTPVGISKTGLNTFKLVYDESNRKSEDLYVIIAIEENGKIKILTIYGFSKERRERHYEP